MAHSKIVVNALRDIIYLAQPVNHVQLAALHALATPLTVHRANQDIF